MRGTVVKMIGLAGDSTLETDWKQTENPLQLKCTIRIFYVSLGSWEKNDMEAWLYIFSNKMGPSIKNTIESSILELDRSYRSLLISIEMIFIWNTFNLKIMYDVVSSCFPYEGKFYPFKYLSDYPQWQKN